MPLIIPSVNALNAPRTTAHKVILVLGTTFLLLGAGIIIWGHQSRLRSLRTQALDRMGGITATLAAQLDGGRVSRLLNKYDSRGMLISSTQDAYYYVLHENLRKSAEVSGAEQPLEVIVYDSAKQELQIAVTSAPKPAFRDPCHSSAAAAIKTYLQAGGTQAQRGVYGDQLASFDAVRDPLGRVVAVVLAQRPAQEIAQAAYSTLWRNLAIAVLAFIAVAFLVLRNVGRMVRREEDARSLWQQRHEGISDSIAYAGKIQGALIPKPERYAEMFSDHFVLNRPKDVVSGDFHWYHRLSENECLVAAADCTGHGLPGAMMAAIGCSLLNELVVQHPHTDPAELLGLLNERMIQALNQNG